jgi:hypothetical protein
MKRPPIARKENGRGSPLKCLIVREPYANRILTGKKTREYRSTNTKIRGVIGIIPATTKKVAGTVEIIDVKGPLPDSSYAYVLRHPLKFKQPKPYNHPNGAVRWVNVYEKI